jgi:transmembrane sensor
MNTNRQTPSLPPELQEALEEEPDAAELARLWAALEHARPDTTAPPSERAEDWAALQARLTAAERAPLAPSRPPHRHAARTRAPRWRAPAVALAAVLIVAGALLLSRPTVLTTASGETLLAELPDGSTVELNSASRVAYTPGWRRLAVLPGRERRVRLDGEAFFAVRPGERPFVVETFNAEVVVLGTSFNVRARQATGTRVALQEGRLAVAPGSGPAGAVELARGEVAVVRAGRATRSADAAVEHATAWREGGFAAQNEPLRLILEELERRFGKELRLENRAAAEDTLTLYFPRPADLETIVRDVATARELRFRPTSRGFVLY